MAVNGWFAVQAAVREKIASKKGLEPIQRIGDEVVVRTIFTLMPKATHWESSLLEPTFMTAAW